MPWPTLALIFPLCLFVCDLMAQHLRVSLVTSVYWNGRCGPSPMSIIWLYAAVATAIMLAPAPTVARLLSLLFSFFLFRMTLTDALTGLLPREMTVSCLTGGLLAAFLSPGFTGHLISAGAALAIFGSWRYITFKIHARECLGLGDVCLAGAIGAWLGGRNGLYALLTGVVLFVLWQLSTRRIHEGGPMGPWLCAGAISLALLKLYQPLITW
jgi:general secretion pathway protein O